MDWIKTVYPSQVPDEGVVVETKIDDENGVRNVQKLVRRGKMWWFPDMIMYVYYTPTHWRLIQPKES